jgi:hypothetical protein
MIKVTLETANAILEVTHTGVHAKDYTPAVALQRALEKCSLDCGNVDYTIKSIKRIEEGAEEVECFKPYAKWKNNFSEYVNVGDVVDEAMFDYWLNVLPPLSWSRDYLQSSEPYSHTVEGKATYTTFGKEPHTGHWTYLGHCTKGERTPSRSQYGGY